MQADERHDLRSSSPIMKPTLKMDSAQIAGARHGRLMQIGTEIFAVFGNDECGWSVDPGDLCTEVPAGCRYRSRDELFFALVNLYFTDEGRA